ncbi:MAG: beta-ketoacyl-[acyl-carrier-protein] synthase family protein [candidate division FCPU426 bacterium]
MAASGKRRVVITGMATINPLGDTLAGYYDQLLRGVSGVKVWTSLDLSQVECKIGGDLGDYNAKAALERLGGSLPPLIHKKTAKLFKTATFSNRLTLLCSLGAWLDAGLFGLEADPFATSVLVAGHNFNSRYILKNSEQFKAEPLYIDPLFGVEALDPNIAASVTEVLGARGPAFTVGAACASGNIALREGFRDVATGECERAVVAGAVFDMTAADIHAMAYLDSVVVKPEYQQNPAAASRPFDRKRCGFVPSHGAGTLILEELSAARQRGARIYAEVLAVKANANANHLPAPSAESQERLIKDLLAATGVKPEQIDYINCHATGTPQGDLEEIRAIKAAFGPHAYRLKLNAPKSMLGHVCWSAPVVETIGAVLQMNHNRLHPTINVDELDPEIDLDVCANQAQDHEVRYLLKNSFGFGGLNCCALLAKVEGKI